MVDKMLDSEDYFILHAPRQSGKTTFLKFLTNKINKQGEYYALYCSLATLRLVKDKSEALNIIVSQINIAMDFSVIKAISKKAYSYNSLNGMDAPDTKIRKIINALCQDLDKDLVVFFDEADLLTGPGLLTFLAQVRDGYNFRDEPGNKFPRSLALVGMRNIRDYLASEHPEAAGQHLASPFNIVADRLTLANFTQDEIGRLYRQHTEATGQVFEDEAVARAWHWSGGQPWLVNALARQIVEVSLGNDYSARVTAAHFDEAAEALIKRRDTHLDSLLARLEEPRVKKIMGRVLAGTVAYGSPSNDDRLYCQELGLLTLTDDKLLKPANPIYKDVIVRALTDQIDQYVPKTPINIWSDGKILLLSNLLQEFQKFWRKIMDIRAKKLELLEIIQYDEANHVVILLSFFQRAVNSGAKLDYEYAEGRGRVDICATYHKREYLVEVKLKGVEPLNDSLLQLSNYLDRANEKEGWLIIFDKDPDVPFDDKFYIKTEHFKDKIINVIGC
jgi:hypothetical protein